MERTYKLLEDIEVVSDENSVIVGSRGVDEYVKFNCKDNGKISKFVELFKTDKTVGEIYVACRDLQISIDIDNFILEVDKRGLFVDSNPEIKPLSEMKNLTFFNFDKKFTNKDVKNIIFFRFLKYAVYFTIVFSIVYIAMNPYIPAVLFDGSFLVYNDSYSMGFIMTFISSVIILLIHELGHVIFAAGYNIPLESFGFSLYLGIFPKWYTKFRGIRIEEKRKRMLVYASGTIMNIFLILSSCLLVNTNLDISIIRTFILSNALMILNCMMPFSLTDGYFLFSDILNVSNLRSYMFGYVSDVLKGKFQRINVGLFLYIVVSAIFYIYRIVIFYYWILKALLEYTGFAYVAVAILGILHLYVITKMISQKYSLR